MLRQDAIADVAALSFAKIVELVTDGCPADDLSGDVGDQERPIRLLSDQPVSNYGASRRSARIPADRRAGLGAVRPGAAVTDPVDMCFRQSRPVCKLSQSANYR